MKNNYTYSEVLDILDNMEEKYREMLPEKLIEFFKNNKSQEYKKHINPRIPLEEQNISKEAITIMAMINLKYWVKDEKHKSELIEKYNSNTQEINDAELKKFFNSGEVNNNSSQDNDIKNSENKSISEKSQSVIIYKTRGFFKKLLHKFLKVLKKEGSE